MSTESNESFESYMKIDLSISATNLSELAKILIHVHELINKGYTCSETTSIEKRTAFDFTVYKVTANTQQ